MRETPIWPYTFKPCKVIAEKRNKNLIDRYIECWQFFMGTPAVAGVLEFPFFFLSRRIYEWATGGSIVAEIFYYIVVVIYAIPAYLLATISFVLIALPYHSIMKLLPNTQRPVIGQARIMVPYLSVATTASLAKEMKIFQGKEKRQAILYKKIHDLYKKNVLYNLGPPFIKQGEASEPCYYILGEKNKALGDALKEMSFNYVATQTLENFLETSPHDETICYPHNIKSLLAKNRFAAHILIYGNDAYLMVHKMSLVRQTAYLEDSIYAIRANDPLLFIMCINDRRNHKAWQMWRTYWTLSHSLYFSITDPENIRCSQQIDIATELVEFLDNKGQTSTEITRETTPDDDTNVPLLIDTLDFSETDPENRRCSQQTDIATERAKFLEKKDKTLTEIIGEISLNNTDNTFSEERFWRLRDALLVQKLFYHPCPDDSSRKIVRIFRQASVTFFKVKPNKDHREKLAKEKDSWLGFFLALAVKKVAPDVMLIIEAYIVGIPIAYDSHVKSDPFDPSVLQSHVDISPPSALQL